MQHLIKNVEYTISKLEWMDFFEFVSDVSEESMKVSLEIEFGMGEPEKVDSRDEYISSIAYILNFVDKNPQNDSNNTISLINCILRVHLTCVNNVPIDFTNLSEENKDQLGSLLMKTTWPDLKNIFQNILDMSKYEKNVKLPNFLSQNENP